jgi:hypothetical protein
MNYETLGNLGDFIGGIAVVATLIYLAVQVRQSSRHVEASVDQARAQAIREGMNHGVARMLAQDENLMALYLKGLRSFDALNELESARFSFLMGELFGGVESNLLMYNEGLLSEERWNAQQTQISMYASAPGVRKWWKIYSGHFTATFRDIVEIEIQEAEGFSSKPA